MIIEKKVSQNGPADRGREAALREEEARLCRLQNIVDGALEAIRSDVPDIGCAIAIARMARVEALGLFPMKSDAYEIIYEPRFRRVIRERFGPQGAPDEVTILI